jgi:hypothetical protein
MLAQLVIKLKRAESNRADHELDELTSHEYFVQPYSCVRENKILASTIEAQILVGRHKLLRDGRTETRIIRQLGLLPRYLRPTHYMEASLAQ